MGKYIKTSERVHRANHGAAFKASSWTSYLPATKKYRDNYDAIDWSEEGSKDKTSSESDNSDIPKPGTSQAIDMGCACPILDNRDAGGVVYYYNSECPLHCPKVDKQ